VWGSRNPLDTVFDALVAVAAFPDHFITVASLIHTLGACWLGQADLVLLFLSQLQSLGMAAISHDGVFVAFRPDISLDSDDEVQFVSASCVIDGTMMINRQ
jgi:hypothetical protein